MEVAPQMAAVLCAVPTELCAGDCRRSDQPVNEHADERT